MKKLLLSLIALLGIGVYAMADEVTVNNVQIKQGKSATMQISLNITSATQYRDFQFDLSLPEGITVGTRVAGTTTVLSGSVGPAASEHSLGGNQLENGLFRYVANNNNAIQLTSGVLVENIELVADASLAVGTKLQGELKDFYITDEASVQHSFDTTFSIEILADEVVLDENSTTAPEAVEGTNVRVKRTINANEWSTICLPFTMTEAQVKAAFGDGVELGNFKGYVYDKGNDQINVKFESATAIEANHPYVIKVSNSVSEFSVENVDINPEDEPTVAAITRTKKAWSEMIGTYVAETTLDKTYLFLAENKFWYANSSTKMKAFRAYFDFYDELVNKTRTDSAVRIEFDGATRIDGIQDASDNNAVYTLDGRRVSRTPQTKGVFIQNGKKVVK